jgi:hypothetical protein
LDSAFEELLGSAALRGQWFAQMLQLSFVGGLTGEYVDFSTAQRAALIMVAQRAGREVSDSDAIAMVDRMSRLPPHAEVPTALQALRSSPLQVCRTRQFAGIGRRGSIAVGRHPQFLRRCDISGFGAEVKTGTGALSGCGHQMRYRN